VGGVLLLGFQVRFAAVRGLTETLPDGLLDLLGDDLWLEVFTQIAYVRGHAAPDLEHLPL
jgi:hypothetical protein